MDCIVHGVTKSQTRLSDFHFTSLHSTQHVSPTTWLLQQPLGSRRSVFAQDTSVPAPMTCDRSLVNGDPRNFAAGSITESFAQTLGILAKHPLFT